MRTPDLRYYVSPFCNSYLSGQKNVSRNTIISYATTFKQFLQFCEETKMIKAEWLTLNLIDEDPITEFYNAKRPLNTLNYKTPDQFEMIHESKKEIMD